MHASRFVWSQDVRDRPEEGTTLRVLVTGSAGYIGSVLTGVLRNEGHEVVGLDCDFYRDCDFGRVRESIPSFDLDIRDVEPVDVLPYDAVVHLAALPAAADTELDADTVLAINEHATIRLAESCKKAGVHRFLFASTWKVYGCTHEIDMDETSCTEPVSADAAMKLRCEQVIGDLADESFATIALRHADVYGVSPRLRLDQTVNDFVAGALTSGRVQLVGDGRAWRPVIHIDDLARAYAAVLGTPDDNVHRPILNVVPPEENYREIDIADTVTDLALHSVRHAGSYSPNESSCRMNGTLFVQSFRDFRFRWTLALGIRQLCQALGDGVVTGGDWRSDRYRRLPRLKSLIERGGARADLRPRVATAAP